MFRSGASRSLLRSLNNTAPTLRANARPQLRSQVCTIAHRPQIVTAAKPLVPKSLALARWQSRDERPTVNKVDEAREERISHKEIKATPETVSSTSTVINPNPLAATQGKGEDSEPMMMAGIYSDLVYLPLPLLHTQSTLTQDA